ncbi:MULTISPECIES: hypothetical protein [Cupriavidus]|uniref:Uncharacterized protein n=1 Tax=Cupriavidus oxalaticus TaxID=96344 RepID=A0A4P7LAQ0_9BURK|nr:MULTISPECIES: hypothetical protein [Cupriavidus]MBF6989729.1 hypothetical protein [Cupriavidus sp. IK-TO18]QBY52870.1 hypothetical protein E0W60_17090 [Cupriavidus oxalaticus]
MIVKPRQAAALATSAVTSPATSPAMPTVANVPKSVLFQAASLAVLALASGAALMPVRPALAQASAPAAGAPRDFGAERKAIGDSRAWTNYRFSAAEHECYSKFFVNSCIDKAKEVQREELQVLRKRELEVGEAERAHRAAERDREQALRRAEFEASQPQRAASEQSSRAAFEKKQQEQQLRDAQRQGEAPQRAANAQAYQQKQSDYDAKMKEAQQKGAEQARQREENVKAYEAKQRDLERRQKELEERRAKAKEQQGQASAPRPFGF